jgi:hypothetical protein
MTSFAYVAKTVHPAEQIVHKDCVSIEKPDVVMRMYVNLLKERDVKPKERKRPLTTYNVFVQKKMPFLRKMQPTDHLKTIGAMWSAMPIEEKKTFA